MAERIARARWTGPVESGEGLISLGSKTFEGAYSFEGRVDGTGTNPEELVGAAHAGCFTMALSSRLTKEGFPPTRLDTVARVHLASTPEGFRIPLIELETEGLVDGIDEARFQELARSAKDMCPVSVALAGVEISLQARLAVAR